MNFSNNLKILMEVLNCSNIKLAKHSSLDPTLISKYKNGTRIPTENSESFILLINALAKITLESKKEKEIKNICNNNENNINDSINNFFINNSLDIRLQKENNVLIGPKLEKIMYLLNITNVMLSKYINKDSSLISKYKKGKRFILRNDIIIQQICAYFAKIVNDNNYTSELYNLIKHNTNNIYEDIYNYLFTKDTDDSPINIFLENLNDFKINNFLNIIPINSLVSKEILNDKSDYYIGIEGFRTSVKRFLGTTIINSPTTLYLFSDESMKWMTDNKEFYTTWKMLMINVLSKKNKIKIIHNINRNADEMFKAIDSWLPLYMTGLIEPFYNIKNNNNMFNHTLFISENNSVISSVSIQNNKSNTNVYYYNEDNNIINGYKKQYMQLINTSNSLIKIYFGDNIDKKNDYSNNYYDYCLDNLDNISIKLKKDNSELLVYKKDNTKVLFEFTYSKMIEAFINYLNK